LKLLIAYSTVAQIGYLFLMFNNAGISGGGSMVTNSRDEWERMFNICWGGVYNCTRAFLPMLHATRDVIVKFLAAPRRSLSRQPAGAQRENDRRAIRRGRAGRPRYPGGCTAARLLS
jgi:NAD(P)-dependent dehydrogenase (short-subunit alcohol dehydrogenase family)